ncbi:MAG: hypothetical protein IPH07_16555 [Deltaproteobacteria bacterium]|nr:hypothetical protein [Deltaproteobacteria bacterium]MBK8720267.1 hypothetical protein [Deltaproteobacteria bacterium]MBP7287637.1 hypothetical protein [Nannocystaceae bacterium]
MPSFSALAIVLVLAPAPSTWKPAEAPPPAVWARAGARGWAGCEELGRQAAALRGGTARGEPGGGDGSVWTERAQRCPSVPDVLVLAALLELVASGDIGTAPEGAGSIDAIAKDHRERVERALGWIDHALAESARRREPPPRETRFLRAYALVTLGRTGDARRALDHAIASADVERWRSDRMGAVIALLDGDLELAMALSFRAIVEAPPDDRSITRYIRAMVLDRAGASATARSELLELRNEAGSIIARRATESLLPVHERLYLRAIDHQVADDFGTAAKLWSAYLERPEPAAPERVLAERHRAELVRKPPPVR